MSDAKSPYLSDSYETLELLARGALAIGDLTKALELYGKISRRLSNLKPEVLQRRSELRDLYGLSLMRQAMIQHWQGNFEQAEQLYQQMMSVVPDRARPIRRLLALVHIDMGRIESGLDELRALAVASPGDIYVWLTLAAECQTLGRLDEAEENLRRAVRNATHASEQEEAYLALFDFYREQGRVEEALAAWNQAWAAQGKEPEYIFPVYQMMWEAGNSEQAYAYLEREKNPLRKGFYQGKFAADQGKLDEATRHWQRVANLDPFKYSEGQEAWAEAALRVNIPPRRVLGVLQILRQTGETTPQQMILEAASAARLGHLEDAAETLKQALAAGFTARPRRTTLPPAQWELLDELIGNEAICSQLRRYVEGDQQTAPGVEEGAQP